MASEVQVFELIDSRGDNDDALPVNFLTKQTLTIGGAASAAFNPSTNQVVVVSTTGCVVEFGAAPDGLGTTFPIVAGQLYRFAAHRGLKVIAASGTATAPTVSLSGATGATASQVQGNVAAAATDSGNPVKVGGVFNTTPPAITNGQRGDTQLSARGATRVELWGSTDNIPVAVLGPSGVTDSYVQYASVGAIGYSMVFNGSLWDRARGDTNGAYVVNKPVTSGGLLPSRVVTGTNGVVKASAGQLYALASVRNANAAVRYLHFYDKATAGTLSTDTPVLTITLLASAVLNNIDLTNLGVAFANGISWQFTTDNAAIPTTAGASGDIMFCAAYK